ncbi:MAG: alpha-glucan family phosphorylase, partial [Bacteroidales bacterium]
FIEDYDINLAKKLVQGVDIWLNTPTRPMEASGTSGMKAVMNGVLHFSVLDGWWVEGYRENAGWALPAERTYQNQDFQNELDAQVIFSLLENEIVPLFYNRDQNGIPHEWIKFIKNSIAEIAPQFTTKRMIDDYIQRYYSKLYSRSLEMKKNEYELAVKIAEWKRNVRRIWDDVKVISARFPDYETQPMNLNENFYGEVTLDLNMLSPEDLGVEVVITDSTDKINANILAKYPGKLVEINNKIARYEIVGSTKKPGFYNYAVRIYAKNDLLPYPQDSGLVKWV